MLRGEMNFPPRFSKNGTQVGALPGFRNAHAARNMASFPTMARSMRCGPQEHTAGKLRNSQVSFARAERFDLCKISYNMKCVFLRINKEVHIFRTIHYSHSLITPGSFYRWLNHQACIPELGALLRPVYQDASDILLVRAVCGRFKIRLQHSPRQFTRCDLAVGIASKLQIGIAFQAPGVPVDLDRDGVGILDDESSSAHSPLDILS